jgi:hypothetical protein
MRQPPPPSGRRRAAALKAQATAARKAKRAEAKAARLAAAAAERPDADAPTLLAENDTLQRQLKAARTEIKNLKAELRYFTNLRGTIFTPDLEKKIRVCLHPDWVTDPKQQRRYNETLAEFNAVIDATKKTTVNILAAATITDRESCGLSLTVLIQASVRQGDSAPHRL